MVVSATLAVVNRDYLTLWVWKSFTEQHYFFCDVTWRHFFLLTAVKQQQLSASFPFCSDWEMSHLLSFKCSALVLTFHSGCGNTSATFGLIETFLSQGLCRTKQTLPRLASYRLDLELPFSPASNSFSIPLCYGVGSCYARLKCHISICMVYYTVLIRHMQPSAPPASLPIWALLQPCLCSPCKAPSGWEHSSWAHFCWKPGIMACYFTFFLLGYCC